MTGSTLILITLIYLVPVNLLSCCITVYDKKQAQANKRRIPEKVLILIGLIGGAAGEYITMRKIHHKTRHKKFMIGLPLIIFLHIAAAAVITAKAAAL